MYGASYLEFAIENPQLYRLMLGQVELTGRKAKKENTNMEKDDRSVISSSHKPFVLLREAFALRGISGQKAEAQAQGAWSMVHGMAALIIEGQIQVPEGMSLKHFLAAATPVSD